MISARGVRRTGTRAHTTSGPLFAATPVALTFKRVQDEHSATPTVLWWPIAASARGRGTRSERSAVLWVRALESPNPYLERTRARTRL